MKKNVFDNMTILPSSTNNLNENTVYEDTGIELGIIKKNVFSQIGIKRNPKKKLLKKILIVAAAAALCTSMLAIPVVAENLYVLYSSVVGGDEYTADFTNVKNADIKIHDPNLQIDSIQVSANRGADNLIDIRLSKKNGDKFTDDNFNIVRRGNIGAWFSDSSDTEHNRDLELIIENNDKNSGKGLEYDALYGIENDGKILRILININLLSDNQLSDSLQGRKIRIKSNNYCVCSIDKVLGSFEDMTAENQEKASKLQEDSKEILPYDIFTNSYYYSDIMYADDKFDVVKGRGKTISLPFEIEFTMDCEPVNNFITLDNQLLEHIFGNHAKEGVMTVSSAGFYLYAKNDKVPDEINWKQSYIKLKNGDKYYLIANGCEYTDEYTLMKCSFGKFPDNELSNFYDKKLYLIDTENISEVVLSGVSVYKSN